MIFYIICGLSYCVVVGIVFFLCVSFLDKGEICAALIQGLFILGMGMLVLIASHFAYQTVTRKIQLKEEKKRLAYRFMLKEVISNLIHKITPEIADKISKTDGTGADGKYTSEILFPIVRIPEPLNIRNWENLAMLEESELSSLINMLSIIEKNNLFAALSKIEYLSEDSKHSQEALALKEAAESEIIHGMNQKEFYLNANKVLNTLKEMRTSLSENYRT